jgi:Lsr2
MTLSATPMLTGATGQHESNTTVRFGVNGRDYEIDLSARHAGELRSMVGRYLSVARRIQPAPARQRPRRQPRPPGTAEPASRGGATGKPVSLGETPRAARDEPAASPSMAATAADARSGEHGLTDRERHELRTIADTARPERTIVAGRLRTKGLADRDSAGNWWPTDAGRRELISA